MLRKEIASAMILPVILASCEPIISNQVEPPVVLNQKIVDSIKDEVAKKAAQDRMDKIKENCLKNVDGYIEGTEQSILVKKPDGTEFGYGFCNAEFEDGTKGTVVAFYEENGKAYPIDHDLMMPKGESLEGTGYVDFGYQEPGQTMGERVMTIYSDGSVEIYDATGTAMEVKDPNAKQSISQMAEKLIEPNIVAQAEAPTETVTEAPTETATTTATETAVPSPTVTETEVNQGTWEKYLNTDYMVYRDGNGKVEMAEVNNTKYAAELVEVQGLPSVLILTSQDLMKNSLENRKVALNPNVAGANNNIEQAYMAALAAAKLRAAGNDNPTLAQMQTTVAEIEKQIQETGKASGITFTDNRGNKSNLTGQPLIIKLEPYTSNNPNWPMTTMYTYNFSIDNNSLIMNLFIMPYTMDQLKKFVYADDLIANEDLMQDFNVQKSIIWDLSMVFQALGGDKPSALLSRPETEQFTRGDYQMIRNGLDPDYINYRNIWIGSEFVQKLRAADLAHDTATMKKLDAGSDYPLRPYIGTGSLDAAPFDVALLDK